MFPNLPIMLRWLVPRLLRPSLAGYCWRSVGVCVDPAVERRSATSSRSGPAACRFMDVKRGHWNRQTGEYPRRGCRIHRRSHAVYWVHLDKTNPVYHRQATFHEKYTDQQHHRSCPEVIDDSIYCPGWHVPSSTWKLKKMFIQSQLNNL